MSYQQLELLFEAVGKAANLLILTHNNPDPDAIASAFGLSYLLAEKLGVESQIVYRGIIGRAENRALLRYLDHPLKRFVATDLDPATPIALVDTQPGAGNNALPHGSRATIVIDHHPRCKTFEAAATSFIDVRPGIGATATIMTEYLRAANLSFERRLATALFYGIKTDTMGLGRGTDSSDTNAFCYLLPQIDIEALFKIQQAQVPADYFKNLAMTLQGARIYNGIVTAYIGQMSYPDLVAEMADLLLRRENSKWAICVGVYHDRLILSVRSYSQQGAGRLAQQVIGSRGTAGGHGSMAGGNIILKGKNPEELAEHLITQALQVLNVPPKAVGNLLV